MSYTAAIQPTSSSTALALSLLSSASDPSSSTAHLTAHIRAALRSEQFALNEAKSRSKRARTRMEELVAEREVLRAQRDAVGLQTESEQHNPVHEQANLLPLEAFYELASDDLKTGLPPPTDPTHTQTLTLARLTFELAQIQEREVGLAGLRRELIQIRAAVARAKKGAIGVDGALKGLIEAAAQLEEQMAALVSAATADAASEVDTVIL